MRLLLPPGEHQLVFRNKALMAREPAKPETPAYAVIPLALAYLAAQVFFGAGGHGHEMDSDQPTPLKTVVLWTTNLVDMAEGSFYWTDGLVVKLQAE